MKYLNKDGYVMMDERKKAREQLKLFTFIQSQYKKDKPLERGIEYKTKVAEGTDHLIKVVFCDECDGIHFFIGTIPEADERYGTPIYYGRNRCVKYGLG